MLIYKVLTWIWIKENDEIKDYIPIYILNMQNSFILGRAGQFWTESYTVFKNYMIIIGIQKIYYKISVQLYLTKLLFLFLWPQSIYFKEISFRVFHGQTQEETLPNLGIMLGLVGRRWFLILKFCPEPRHWIQLTKYSEIRCP